MVPFRGTHEDLIGVYKVDMREADDDLISSASLYVDSRETTVHHIGELMMPIVSGAISEASFISQRLLPEQLCS